MGAPKDLDIDNKNLFGVHGENARVVVDENGVDIMERFNAFRRGAENYRVSDALGTYLRCFTDVNM